MEKPVYRRCRASALIASWLTIVTASAALAACPGSAHTASTRLAPYLAANQQEEIALARTAAPPAVSRHATVVVLGAHGYATAVKGSNGFVCLVERSWSNALSVKPTDFWNPKVRAPFCFNAAGARSVLPRYLTRTTWVLSGASEREIGDRERAAWAAGTLHEPAPGAMCYMMSRRGQWIGNHPGAWRPHLMFYFPSAAAPDWGANAPATPVFRTAGGHTTVFVVLVPAWSDGSPAPHF